MRSASAGLALLVLAAWLRLQGLDWDQGQHLHPDERFLTMVESAIQPPASIGAYFDTAKSPLNPANHNYGFFVYGTLPLFLVRAVAGVLGMADYGNVHFVGRVVSALFDLGSLVLVGWIARRWFGARAGLIAAVLYAAAVLPIQSAHFFTVDTAAAFFTTLSLAFLLEVGRGAGWLAHLGFALAFGCALACRINLLVLAPFYPLAGLVAAGPRWRPLLALAGRGAVAALLIALVFRVLQPYAFAGPGFFDLSLAPAFLSSMETIRGLATGAADYPPGVQWIGRTPILFPARNLFWWGLGPGLASAAALGLLLGVFRPRFGPSARDGAAGAARWIALFALLPFAYHASQFVTTGRYFLPWIPAAAIAAGRLLATDDRRWRRGLALVVVVSTALWALAFTAIYRRPHSRVEASQWIHAHIPAGSVLGAEHWDDALPLALPDKDSRAYRIRELELYHDDTPTKRADLIDRLAEADALVLSSNRLYRSIPRTPWRYPLGRRYYELLFAGELGFRLEVAITSYPRLGPLEIADDDAEEAFTVYDHPKVLIFRKTAEFSRERVERLLGAVPLDGIVRVTPREASTLYRRWRPEDVPLPGEEAVRSAVVAVESSSVAALGRWLVGFALLTGAVFVILARPLARLPDRGLGMAHVVAWLLPGYAAWLASAFGFAANDALSLRLAFVFVLLPTAAFCWMRGRAGGTFSLRTSLRELAVTESVFVVGFSIFTLLRSLNPAIYWGEKPMDFAILNALLRSRSMPPADPWWAGESLNYYYFGHQLVAGFAALVGVPPAFAFNLAIATIGGLTALGAYLAARRFGGVAGGLAAAAAASLLGNLEGLRLWLSNPGRSFNFDYFWATTRLWENSINEFPFWNLVFADLHSHVIAQPLSLAAIALGMSWIANRDGERPVARPLLFGLVAWLTGAIAVTSSWSAPVAFAAQAALLGTDAWRAPRRGRALAAAAALWIALVVVARLLYEPYWAAYRAPAFGWGFETATAPLGAVIRYFGALWFALVPVLGFSLVRGGRRRGEILVGGLAFVAVVALAATRSPAAAAFLALATLALAAWVRRDDDGLRAAAALTVVAGAIGVGTEIIYVADRMNTVFKFYLESWLLLAVAAGIALPQTFGELHGLQRAVYASALAVVVGLGFFTSLTGAIGATIHRFAPSRVPTLDGQAYLERMRPQELGAYRWLQREVGGVPVVLEAQGASYQDFGRVSMNTGLPTVVGWEWHLIQQGHARERYDERKTDVRTIYETTDPALADRLLRKYGVAFVFVGALERRTYATAGFAKFEELLDVVYRDGQTTIYARPGAVDSARTWIEPAKVSDQGWTPPVGRLREPRDVAVAPDGSIWVADFGHRRVQRFDGELQPLAAFGREGDAEGEFRDPCGVAVADDGRLFVADTWNHRIQVLDAAGNPLAQWSAEFYGPRGIAIAGDGSIVVTDTGHHEVVRLDPSGRVLNRFGAGRLGSPIGVAVSAEGEVFVADPEKREIVVFALDGAERRAWRVPFWSPGGIVEPYLAVGSDGVVWATDPGGRRVLRYDREGKFLGLASFSRPLALPLGLALLDDRTVVVADAGDEILVRGSAPVAKTVTPSARNASGKSSGVSSNLAKPAAE